MQNKDLDVPIGVLWGTSYDSIVVLDKDNMAPIMFDDGKGQSGFGYVSDLVKRVSHRWNLGDALIILSSVDWMRQEHDPGIQDGAEPSCSFYFVFDRIVRWGLVHEIITTLARERFLEDKLRSLQLLRGDFTHRMIKKERGGFIPFPFAYVPCTCKRPRGFTGGGLEVWLSDWKLACRIAG